MDRNIVYFGGGAKRCDREQALGQRGMVIWFTGLSGSGKSTIAASVERRLVEQKRAAFLIDGDNVRHGLCSDLGFDEAGRTENIRRIAEVAALFEDAGVITLVSAISPFDDMRQYARDRALNFRLVYVKAKLESCIARDPKGLYAKALAGEIIGYTGIDSPYEDPMDADLVLNTDEVGLEDCVDTVLRMISEIGGEI